MTDKRPSVEELIDMKKLVGDKVMIALYDSGEQVSESGLITLPDDHASMSSAFESGVRPRWAYVVMASEEAQASGIVPGIHILVEHGKWTRRHPVPLVNGEYTQLWFTFVENVLLMTDERKVPLMQIDELCRLSPGIEWKDYLACR